VATVFTTVGKQWSVDKWDETVSTTPSHIGWGTGAGTAAVGDTTLFTEDTGGSPAYARVATTLTQPSADTLQATGTITSNGTKTITNAGVFTASTSGTLLLKADFTGVPLLLNDSIAFTFTLQQT
jgi:hypothetical protein